MIPSLSIKDNKIIYFLFIFINFHYSNFRLSNENSLLGNTNIPSKTANSLQIIKMCEAFSIIKKDISLIVPNLICSKKSVTDYYDLNAKIKFIK